MFYTKEAIEEHFEISYLSSLEFASDTIHQKILQKCAKKLEKKKHATFNHWTNALFGDELKEQKEIAYVIKKVNPIVGWGLFAKEKIAPLTFIGEYTGVVRKRERRKDHLNDYVFGYVIGPDDTPWVIDAEKKGNFTRFINHSYEPNVTSRWIIREGLAHILFFANRVIDAGEEITYDYGPYYWRGRPYPMQL